MPVVTGDSHGDGSGWAYCAGGHRHWGHYGAAGLLLHTVDDEGGHRVLLQLRAGWSHQGGTWGLPGGARDSTETPEQAALREAVEETAICAAEVTVTGSVVDADCGWPYVTVLATCPSPIAARPAGGESDDVRWVAEGDVLELPLHPRLVEMWPRLVSALHG